MRKRTHSKRINPDEGNPAWLDCPRNIVIGRSRNSNLTVIQHDNSSHRQDMYFVVSSRPPKGNRHHRVYCSSVEGKCANSETVEIPFASEFFRDPTGSAPNYRLPILPPGKDLIR